MNHFKQHENNLIGNLYLYQTDRSLLSEQEQKQAAQQIQKQKISAEIAQSQTAEKVLKAAQDLYNKLKDTPEFKAAQQKGGAALEQYLIAAFDSSNKQTAVRKESLELEEGVFGRAGSMISAAKDRLMGDKPTSNLPLRVQAVLKHFEKLKTNVGTHLRELQRDMGTTSNIDTKVKDLVNQHIADLGNTAAKHGGITPTQSKLGDFRHAAGRAVGFLSAAAAVGAATAPLGAAVAGIASLKGLGAVAAASAVKGGVFKVVHSLATGQGAPKATDVAKIMALAAVGGVVGNKVGSFLHDVATKPIEAINVPGYSEDAILGGHDPITPADSAPTADGNFTPGIDSDSPISGEAGAEPPVDPMYSDVDPSSGDTPEQASRDFINQHGEPLTPGSEVDNIKAYTSRMLRMKGIMGTMSSGESVPSPAVHTVIDKWAQDPSTRELAINVANKLANVSDTDLKAILSPEVRKAGSAAVTKALMGMIGK